MKENHELMERMFIHDLLNSIGGAHSLAAIMCEERMEATGKPLRLLKNSLSCIMDEIKSYRDLLRASKGCYELIISEVESLAVLQTLSREIKNHVVSIDRGITIHRDAHDVMLQTDVVLLRRVLLNMIKNGLEATPIGGEVTLNCGRVGGDIVFEVHNPTSMSMAIQSSIFKKIVTTKGSGRGLGTFSMKVLGEKCLGGHLSFVSTEEAGTVFTFALTAPA